MHDHCAHTLRLCVSCDVVHCASCKREWGGHRHNWYYQTYPYWQGTLTSSGTFSQIGNATAETTAFNAASSNQINCAHN